MFRDSLVGVVGKSDKASLIFIMFINQQEVRSPLPMGLVALSRFEGPNENGFCLAPVKLYSAGHSSSEKGSVQGCVAVRRCFNFSERCYSFHKLADEISSIIS